VTVSQSNNGTPSAALFQVQQGQAILYSSNCTKLGSGTLTNGSTGASFTGLTVGGHYIIGIKYDTKSIAGTTAPTPANITYTFSTSLGASTGATVQLVKKT